MIALTLQAALKGRSNIIELLLSSKAEVNPRDRFKNISAFRIYLVDILIRLQLKDSLFTCICCDPELIIVERRWERTPLSLAVRLGNLQMANLLRSKGGVILESRGVIDILQAAALGDVKSIKLLVECAGVKARNGTCTYSARFFCLVPIAVFVL